MKKCRAAKYLQLSSFGLPIENNFWVIPLFLSGLICNVLKKYFD